MIYDQEWEDARMDAPKQRPDDFKSGGWPIRLFIPIDAKHPKCDPTTSADRGVKVGSYWGIELPRTQ